MNYLISDDEANEPAPPPAQAPAPASTTQHVLLDPEPSADDDWLSSGDDLLGGDAGNDPWDEPAVVAAPAPAPMAAAPAPSTIDASDRLIVTAPELHEMSPHVHTVGAVPPALSSLVLDVEVPVEVFFGNAALTVEEFLELGAGSVVELDHEVTAPVELRVRDRVVALGQLVTINGHYGLRITDMAEGR